MGSTHKLVIRSNASENKPIGFRCHDFRPFAFVGRIMNICKVQRPIDPCRLGITVVNDVVYMTYNMSIIHAELSVRRACQRIPLKRP